MKAYLDTWDHFENALKIRRSTLHPCLPRRGFGGHGSPVQTKWGFAKFRESIITKRLNQVERFRRNPDFVKCIRTAGGPRKNFSG